MVESTSIVSEKANTYASQFKRYLNSVWSNLNQDCHDCRENPFEFFAFGCKLCYSCCVQRILEDGMPSDLIEGERYPIIPETSLKTFGFNVSSIIESRLEDYNNIKEKVYEWMRKGRSVILQCCEMNESIQCWIYTK